MAYPANVSLRGEHARVRSCLLSLVYACCLGVPGLCQDADGLPADRSAPSAAENAGVSGIATLRYGNDAKDDSATGDERRPPASLPAAVRIRGRLTWISGSPAAGHHFVVQDESSAIWVNVKVARERDVWRGDEEVLAGLVPGMLVEIAGLIDRDVFAPMMIPQSVVIVSEDLSIPAAMPAVMDRVFSGSDNCQRIEIDGILQGFRKASGRWVLVMETDGRHWLATVPNDTLQPDPAHLVDGRLRLRGVAAARFTTRGEFVSLMLLVGDAADIDVIEQPRAEAFATPKLPLARLARFRRDPPSGHRVRTEGVVTHAQPGEFFYLQDGAVGVRVETQSDELLQPGDLVEVAGFIDRRRVLVGASQAAGLVEAVIRRIGSGAPPEPASISPDEIVAVNATALRNGLIAQPGDYDGCLVSFKGRLVEVRRAVTGGILLISSGKSMVAAALFGGTFEILKTLEPGSELQVTGIVRADLKPEVGARPIWLLPAVERMDVFVRSVDDVQVLARPSWWTPRRLAAALAATGGVLAGALGWVWLLRRRVAATAVNLAAEMRTRHEAAVEFNATIRERNRLAANLHDTLLQTMSAIGMQLQSCELSGRDGGKPAASHLGLARRMVDHAVGELRESVWAMRSFPLKGQTLPEAIQSLIAHLAQGHTTKMTAQTTGPETAVSDFVAGNLLLVVQEAVHNALQHATATAIEVVLSFDPPADAIDVTVRDNGKGFTPGTQAGPLQGHFGMQGMRERVERLGGTLRVESAPGRGTAIHARVKNLPYDLEIEVE
jgi:signal transduction histidine kinase